MSGSMAAALTLLALLLELMIGYPDRLHARMIGHPVTWMGALIGALDRGLNRDTATACGAADGRNGHGSDPHRGGRL